MRCGHPLQSQIQVHCQVYRLVYRSATDDVSLHVYWNLNPGRLTEANIDSTVSRSVTSCSLVEAVSKGKGKAIPVQTLRFPGGWGPRFQDSQHMKVVRLSALRTGQLYPQEIFLVLISVRGWVGLRAIVLPQGLCQWKVPVTPSGIEPATFWLVALWGDQ